MYKYILLLLLLLIPETESSCEAYWISNISKTYSSSENLSEPVNAITSLSFTAFGLVGIMLKNHTTIYYLLMNLFILMGISSFLHHYYYSNADWAYAFDIITMELLTSFALFYMISDMLNYRYRMLNIVCSFMILTTCIFMIVFYKINYDIRSSLIMTNMSAIISTQSGIIAYLFYIRSYIKYKVLLTSIWSGLLFTIAIIVWFIDKECPSWMWRRFNGHAVWHVCCSWALFNVTNMTTITYAIINNKTFKWIGLFKCSPGFLFIIVLNDRNLNIKHNHTCIEINDLNKTDQINEINEIRLNEICETDLVPKIEGYHRRCKSYG